MLNKLVKQAGRGIALSTLIFSFSLSAQAVEIYEHSVFLNATELGANSVGQTEIANGFTGLNDFGGAGLDFSFANNLGVDNVGTLNWSITNNSGSNLSNAWLFGFLDAEILEANNSYFNETGSVANFIAGSGSSDAQADSWEIDEPGFVFGDIYNNMQAGVLDNSVGTANPDDVSLALGFNIGDLLAGETLTAIFEISLTDNGGLYHYDPDAQTGFWYNGSVAKAGVSVPEPSSFVLLAIGMLSMMFGLRRRRVI